MANYNLNLYQYNNYSDRQLKREENLDDYGEPVAQVQACNFKFGDGVNTEHVIDGLDSIPACNYAVLFTGPDNIVSRWFIIESDYISNRKFKVTLRRDVLADHWKQISRAPMMVEKATLSDSNPLIYNKENMNFNQIKTSETLLKDDTDVAWICGYVKPRDENTTIDISSDIIYDEEVPNSGTINQWDYAQYFTNYAYHASESEKLTSSFNIELAESAYDPNYITGICLISSTVGGTWSSDVNWRVSELPAMHPYISEILKTSVYDGENYYLSDEIASEVTFLSNTIDSTKKYNALSVFDDTQYISDSLFKTLKGKIGKIIKCKDINGNDEYYKISAEIESTTKKIRLNYPVDDPVYIAFKRVCEDLFSYYGITQYWSNNGYGYLTVKQTKIKFIKTKINRGTYRVTIPGNVHRLKLKDAPYDMFCIPCPIDKNEVEVLSKGNVPSADVTYTWTKVFAMDVAQGIAKGLGSDGNGFLIDLQLLPYCPMTGYTVDNTGKITFSYDVNRMIGVMKVVGEGQAETTQDVGCRIFWAANSNGEKIIPFTAIDVDNKKIQNQCDLYRVCSGNYSSGFDLNIAQNEGLRNITVDYTYIPYLPYIHVTPEFNNLYGRDYNDARGLVDQSDKSISYLSSQWASYVNTNKAYQQQFDRQIQSMEYNRDMNKLSNSVNAIGNALSTGISTGVKTGNAYAGIAAGAVSMAGGILDVSMQEAIANEAIDYAKDNFGFSLANIKAAPDSVAKITAFNKNNKVFPLIEYYTCTDIEKQALANKIKYNGMTVGVIGTINDYINNSWHYGNIEDKGYIKGQIIQIPELVEDSHLVNTIITEMNKGVYTK